MSLLKVVEELSPLLEDSNGRVRRRAAASLAGLGQHHALAWLLEDLRRNDSWFDMRLGRIARAEAAQALSALLGRDALSQYSTRKSPYTDENVAFCCREQDPEHQLKTSAPIHHAGIDNVG